MGRFMHQRTGSTTLTKQLSDQFQAAHDRPMIVHPRMAWILYYEEKRNVHLLCQKFGISCKTFHKWLKRYCNSGGDPASLLDRSRKPHHFPKATSKEIVKLILEAKRETGNGQRKLKQYLAEKYNVSVSEHTIWKLLKRFSPDNGSTMFGTSLPLGTQPGDIVQITAKELGILTNHSHHVQYTALDTCTALRISKIYRKHSWRTAADFIKFIIEEFPFTIKEAQTPNDGAFTYSHSSSGIDAVLSEPVPVILQKANIKHTALTDGKMRQTPVEKIHEIDEEEFFKRNSHRKPEDLVRAGAEYVTLYNNHRKHDDLNGLTPLQKLRTYPDFKNVVYFDPYS